MTRAFLIGVLSLALWGCSNGNSRIQVLDHKPPAGWHGNYVSAPTLIEAQQGKAYSQILFLSGSRAQIIAQDRDLPKWGWTASVSITPDEDLAFRVRCESVVVFRTEGNGRIVYQRARGEAGQYLFEEAGAREMAEKLLGANARLDALVPKALRACDDTEVEFHPKVLKGGEVTLETDTGALSFYPQDSEAYRPMVKRLTEAAGKLNAWDETLSPGIYASPSNAYLPMPQTHRFYRAQVWKGERKAEGGFVLKGVVAEKPSPTRAQGSRGKDDFIYNQIERGEWIQLKPVSAHLYQREVGQPERDLGAGALSTDGLTLELATVPEGLQVEVVYAMEDRPGETFVQTFPVDGEGKRTENAETLELK